MDAATARTRLESQRSDLSARDEAMTAELQAVAAASAGSNLDDEHDPEGATVAFEREQLAAARARVRDQLAELDAAVARLDAGTYGICTDCAQPIAAARLDALPLARRCVTCAARAR